MENIINFITANSATISNTICFLIGGFIIITGISETIKKGNFSLKRAIILLLVTAVLAVILLLVLKIVI